MGLLFFLLNKTNDDPNCNGCSEIHLVLDDLKVINAWDKTSKILQGTRENFQ